MSKIPSLTVVALVLGTTAAFAANTEFTKPDFATTKMCDSYTGGEPAGNAATYCRSNRDNQDKAGHRDMTGHRAEARTHAHASHTG